MDVEVSGVGKGVVIPVVSMSYIPLVVARSAEITGLQRSSMDI